MSLDPAPGEEDPRPRVEVRQPFPPALIILGAGLVVAAMLLLNATARTVNSPRPSSRAEIEALPEPPSLAIPPEPPPPPPLPSSGQQAVSIGLPSPILPLAPPRIRPRAAFSLPPDPQPTALPSLPTISTIAPPKTEKADPAAQALVIDNDALGGAGQQAEPPGAPTGATTSVREPRAASIASGGDDAPLRSSVLRSRSRVLPAGTLIPAVLETPIDSSRPGMLRAVVSRDVAGFDGTQILVARGTRLIGDYDSDVRSGQARVLATWTRMIRPDGVTARLGAPAADALGGGGIPGKVHTFFWQRFGSAALQSALTAGVNYAGTNAGGGSVVVAIPSTQVATSLGQTLGPPPDLRPKVTVKAGAQINVFVAKDLELPPVGA